MTAQANRPRSIRARLTTIAYRLERILNTDLEEE